MRGWECSRLSRHRLSRQGRVREVGYRRRRQSSSSSQSRAGGQKGEVERRGRRAGCCCRSRQSRRQRPSLDRQQWAGEWRPEGRVQGLRKEAHPARGCERKGEGEMSPIVVGSGMAGVGTSERLCWRGVGMRGVGKQRREVRLEVGLMNTVAVYSDEIPSVRIVCHEFILDRHCLG